MGYVKDFLLILLLFTLSTNSYAQNEKTHLHELAQKIKDSLSYSGVLLVSRNDTILLEKAYGYANAGYAIRNKIDTKFRIASLSKMFVSYVIYILVGKKKIDLNDTLDKYFFDLDKKFSSHIRIRHLLNHTSGLLRSIDNLSNKTIHDYYSENELISIVNSTELKFPPGSSFSYSNIGYSLLGWIIEKVTKKEFNQAMSDLIFKPLGLQNTGHEIEGQIVKNKAEGYNLINNQVYKSFHENKSHVFAAGSLYSNTSDLLLFGKEIMTGSLLSESMRKCYLESKNNRTTSGWVTWNYKVNLKGQKSEGQLLMHGGSCPGFRSSLTIFLDHNIIVIGLSNKTPLNTSLVYNKLGNVALGLAPEEIYQPYLFKLTPYIVNRQYDKALRQYENFQLRQPNRESLKVGDLNQLGYSYLGYHKIEEAINIFDFAALLFPTNANIYDSIGEAYMLKGDKINAIKNYKKSLELNPDNKSAKMVIEQISKN